MHVLAVPALAVIALAGLATQGLDRVVAEAGPALGAWATRG